MSSRAAFQPGLGLSRCPLLGFEQTCCSRKRAAPLWIRSRPATCMASLPAREELQSASFLESVRHAETLLGYREASLAESNIALLDTMLQTSNGARGYAFLRAFRIFLYERKYVGFVVQPRSERLTYSSILSFTPSLYAAFLLLSFRSQT